MRRQLIIRRILNRHQLINYVVEFAYVLSSFGNFGGEITDAGDEVYWSSRFFFSYLSESFLINPFKLMCQRAVNRPAIPVIRIA